MDTRGFREELIRTVDDVLGVDEMMQRVPERLDEPGPSAMPAALVEKLVGEAMQRSATTTPPLQLIHEHKRRKARRRGLGLSLCIVLAASLAQWRWGGTDSLETMTYEQAFYVLFDESYPEGNHRSAQGKICVKMQDAVRALVAVPDTSELRGAADRALASLRESLDDRAGADVEALSRLPALEQLTRQLESGRGTRATIGEVVTLVRIGIHALDLVRSRGGVIRSNSDKILDEHLRRELSR